LEGQVGSPDQEEQPGTPLTDLLCSYGGDLPLIDRHASASVSAACPHAAASLWWHASNACGKHLNNFGALRHFVGMQVLAEALEYHQTWMRTRPQDYRLADRFTSQS